MHEINYISAYTYQEYHFASQATQDLKAWSPSARVLHENLEERFQIFRAVNKVLNAIYICMYYNCSAVEKNFKQL